MSKLVTNSNLTFDSFIKQLSHAEIYKKIINKSAIEYQIKAHKI
jgi:hypothetical protein